MLKIFFDSKGYDIKNPTFYVLDSLDLYPVNPVAQLTKNKS